MSPSNPVAPTIFCLENESPKAGYLSPHLSLEASRNLVKALRDAAFLVASAASALLGEGSFVPSSPPAHSIEPPSPAGNASPSIRETVNELLRAKARAARSDRYLRQLRVSLGSFSNGRSNHPVASVTVQEVEKWLFNQNWSPKTMRGYCADIRALFRFAMNRGYVKNNPACGIELPSDAPDKPPAIHTPEEVRAVLEFGRRADLDVMRHLAIRYFAGLRSAEAFRLREEDVKAERGFIEVPASKAKTRRRRLVRIQPCLGAWLALGGVLRPLGEMTVRKVINASKVPWAHNVTRHSFVSYHLAQFESAAKTALEAGHSETMLFAHYREVVTPEDAAKYWAILPATR